MTSDGSSHRHVFSSSKELAREVVQRLCVLGEPTIPGGARRAVCVSRPHSCERKKRHESSTPPAHHQPPATMKKWVARKSSAPTYARPSANTVQWLARPPKPPLTVGAVAEATQRRSRPTHPPSHPLPTPRWLHKPGARSAGQPATHPLPTPEAATQPRSKTRERVNVNKTISRQRRNNARFPHSFVWIEVHVKLVPIRVAAW